MVYIEPSTQIDIFAHAPVDRDLSNFLDFDTETLRDDYYTSLKVISLNEHTYQRAGINKIRVQVPTHKLQTCNYLRFKNVNFHERYFYAFITDINYINNITSEIVYEIDELQTWFYSLTFNECFIERQHVNDDTIGKWRFPENLEHNNNNYEVIKYPNWVDGDLTETASYADLVIITASYDKNMTTSVSGYLNSLYNGLEYNLFPRGKGVIDFLSKVETEKQGGGIVACYDIPARFGLARTTDDEVHNWYSGGANYCEYSFAPPNYIKDYSVVNNKLLTYPYNYILVRSSDGNSGEYIIEDFTLNEEGNINFREYLTVCNTPESLLVPNNYKGNDGYNYNESMLFNDYPQCSLRTNAYSTWLATQKQQLDIQEFGAAISGLASLLAIGVGVSSPVGMGVGTMVMSGASAINSLNRITSIETQKSVAKTTPEQSKKGTGSALSYALETNGFTFYHVSVRPEQARIIDDYFSMYGYAINEIAKPNLRGRKRWNFVKTANCSISGAINSEVERKIENIFNSGITIWHTPDNYRNYGVENPIV